MIKKIGLGLVFFIFVALFSTWLFRFQLATWWVRSAELKAQEKYQIRSPQPILQQHLDAIMEDAKVLSKSDLFNRGTRGTSDAAPFLNPKIPWELGGGEVSPAQLTLPPAVSEIANFNTNFMEARPDWKTLNLDFSWMQELRQFDTWSFDLHGPKFGSGEMYSLARAPVPSYSTLIVWSKLRLLKGREDGDVLSALQEVRQLGLLSLSSENLVGAMTALAILKNETRFLESLPEPTRAKVAWSPLSHDELDRAKRFLFAGASFVDARLSDEVFERLSRLTPGLCQRVQEGLYSALTFRRLMLEEQAAAYARFDKLVTDTNDSCRDSFLRRLWKDPKYPGIFEENADLFSAVGALGEDVENPKQALGPLQVTLRDLESHPSLARSLGYMLLSVAEPNWLKHYEKKK